MIAEAGAVFINPCDIFQLWCTQNESRVWLKGQCMLIDDQHSIAGKSGTSQIIVIFHA